MIVRRLRHWFSHQTGRGVSPWRAVVVGLPRRAARAVWDGASAAWLAMPWIRRSCHDRIRRAFAATGSNRPFVVIAVPDTLHVLLPCLELAGRVERIVLISNGLKGWELDLLRRRFPGTPIARLPSIPGAMIAHGRVVSVLLEAADRDFTLHDPDLYVFRTAVYDELAPGPAEIAVGAYGVTNRRARITFPTTHLVSIRTEALRDLATRFGVGPEVYRRTPAHVAEALRKLDIGDHNLPKDYLPYYDLLNLLWMLALHEGKSLRVLGVTPEDALHIGGVSYDRDNRRLRYVHAAFLALPGSEELEPKYRRRLLGPDTLDGLAESLRADGSHAYLAELGAGMEKLRERLAERRSPIPVSAPGGHQDS